MALLTKQQPAVSGLNPMTLATCAGGGDTVLVGDGGNTLLIVRNLDASSKTVTLVDPRTQYGQASPDVPVVISAGLMAAILVPPEFADSSGIVSITYSAVTSLTVAALRV